ncbi:deaminase [Zafaria sp. Z1313]|uniref:nucleoside deaminase n=1 Tax=unclassified Zafaria TaxID=2828765 RepID=UPI002E7A1C55|nr:nucleoside deaminase [Zafaria sp. J156]MEE1621578.1 nucleoside deaminase [Zafaria sp. J156]
MTTTDGAATDGTGTVDPARAGAGLPASFRLEAPGWLRRELEAIPELLPDPEDRIRLASRLAARTIAEGDGGPFGALVTEGPEHRVVSAGVNLVMDTGLSAMHAEVVALQLAHAAAGARDLGADGARRTLTTNAQPCLMCLGAVIWSGVRELEYAVGSGEVEALTGFDEGPIPARWEAELEARGIAVRGGILREESLGVFGEFRRLTQSGTATVYNARGA